MRLNRAVGETCRSRLVLLTPWCALPATCRARCIQRRLDLELHRMRSFAARSGFSLAAASGVVTAGSVHVFLVAYVQFLYDSAAAFPRATHAVLAIQRMLPRMKHHLTRAWDSVRSWKLSHVVSRRTPLPEPLLHVIVGCAMCKAVQLDRARAHQWFPFAVACLLGFYG